MNDQEGVKMVGEDHYLIKINGLNFRIGLERRSGCRIDRFNSWRLGGRRTVRFAKAF